MYSAEYLARYPFFRELLQTAPLSAVHDSLTGLIARPHILRFIRSLIDVKTPFVLGIIDLDNFKSINDNYGHRTGDEMLALVAGQLRSFFGEDGVVGRYGGDEFLFVYFGCTDYDGLHRFLDDMYLTDTVFPAAPSSPRTRTVLRGFSPCATRHSTAANPRAATALSSTCPQSTTSLRSPPSRGETSMIPFTVSRRASTPGRTRRTDCAAHFSRSRRTCACTAFSSLTRKTGSWTSAGTARSARSNRRRS